MKCTLYNFKEISASLYYEMQFEIKYNSEHFILKEIDKM